MLDDMVIDSLKSKVPYGLQYRSGQRAGTAKLPGSRAFQLDDLASDTSRAGRSIREEGEAPRNLRGQS